MSSENAVGNRMLENISSIERHEIPVVVAAFCLFFCVLGGYFAVRPVRETMGTLLGRERVADLFAATWLASIAIVPIYGMLVGRFRRSVLLPWIYGSISLSLIAVGVVLRANENSIATGQFFYVFISVLNLFVMSVFWSFLLEMFNSEQSKRLFGVIAAGGTAGALFGPLLTDLTVAHIGNSGVLFVGAGMFAAAVVCQRALFAIWRAMPVPATSVRGGAEVRSSRDVPIGGNPFAGFALVLRSPYLLGIAIFVVLLASVSTLLYFEQMRLVQETFANSTERTQVFARLDWIVQSLTIVSQIFITGRVASKLGLTVLLIIVPLGLIFGFLALAAQGTFVVLAVVFVLRRAGEYAFVRPGREMLWSRMDTETKYKAKCLIDVPVYRGADALVAQVSNGMQGGAFGAAGIALVGAVMAALWGINGWWLGRRHDGADAGNSKQGDTSGVGAASQNA